MSPIFSATWSRSNEILAKDFSTIYLEPQPGTRAKRPILSTERSLGSVIKLMTPSPEYTDEHNEWLATVPQTVRQLLITVKRYYRPEWGDDWRHALASTASTACPGNELKFQNQKLLGNYLRMGYDPDGSWRIFKLRPDFIPRTKCSSRTTSPRRSCCRARVLNHLDPEYHNASVKLVANCETLLFQRPDDAIHRGFDKDAEADIASPNLHFEFRAAQPRDVHGHRRRGRGVRQVHGSDEASC